MASDARIPMFCEPDAEVRNKGRQDMLTHLLEVAPPGYEDAIEHESRRIGSLEDTASSTACWKNATTGSPKRDSPDLLRCPQRRSIATVEWARHG